MVVVMPEWLLKGIEITYSVLLPLVVGYIIKLMKQIKADKKETHVQLTNSIKDLEKKFDNLEKKFDIHVEESTERDVRLRRSAILDFANSCMNHRKHTQEEFNYIIQECDSYETYCEKKNIKNGVATAAIGEIKRIYTKCLREDTFLKEGEV